MEEFLLKDLDVRQLNFQSKFGFLVEIAQSHKLFLLALDEGFELLDLELQSVYSVIFDLQLIGQLLDFERLRPYRFGDGLQNGQYLVFANVVILHLHFIVFDVDLL